MGCYCTKNTEHKIIKPKKLSNKKLNISNLLGFHTQNEGSSEIKFDSNYAKNKLMIRRKYFFFIQKKMWIIILDFLPYRDLCQAGLLNKFLNKVAKSQNILLKFYKNKRKSVNTSELNSDTEQFKSNIKQDTAKKVSNHYNYTTINNYNNFNELNSNFHSNLSENNTINPQKINIKSRILQPEENNPVSQSTHSYNNFRDANNSSFYVSLKEDQNLNKETILRMPTLNAIKSDRKVSNSKVSSPAVFKRQDSHSLSVISNSNISHYRRDSLPKEQKIFKMKINNPYVDIFSKKEIEVKLDSNNCNDSFDNISIRSSLPSNSNLSNIVSSASTSKNKFSVSDYVDRSPSFSKHEYLFSLNEEGVEVIKITNITKYNIPLVPVRNKSFSKENFLKVPYDRRLMGGPGSPSVPNIPLRVNSMEVSNSKGLSYLNGEG